ncbi:LOW QUALITY PROTEIN: BRCT domain-containing protein At4g02110 [Dioscorea cayenensis subsp. rotundata]|uniref:LOW QUALITY PROTEIN: BRCT domain-containing protein At4g02110 n=1 Tax=Dioscorea cayennensis subsp. rotundata TaxID=55577 RepID=A0AB40BR06_DIOCR|nr:LOW QUALITY PROTEIN: BRCT domain-containing protein At4g02110 [Dioscorea cayenensis subsp. rotundata]
MLAAGQGSDKIFAGVRFVLCGFDSVSEVQYRSEIVRRGGVDVGRYDSNCTHVIVSGRVSDDPVCIAARKDGITLVSELWVDDCIDFGTLADPNRVLYKPVKDLNGIPGSESLTICLTGYQRQDRDDIMKLVSLMGARFSKPLIANQVTHLICYKFEGEKFELAKKVGIKLVNHRWLEDCLRAWEILPIDGYSKSGWELEILEAQAMDTEEESEDGGRGAMRKKSSTGSTNLQGGVPISTSLDVSIPTKDELDRNQNAIVDKQSPNSQDLLMNDRSFITTLHKESSNKKSIGESCLNNKIVEDLDHKNDAGMEQAVGGHVTVYAQSNKDVSIQGDTVLKMREKYYLLIKRNTRISPNLAATKERGSMLNYSRRTTPRKLVSAEPLSNLCGSPQGILEENFMVHPNVPQFGPGESKPHLKFAGVTTMTEEGQSPLSSCEVKLLNRGCQGLEDRAIHGPLASPVQFELNAAPLGEGIHYELGASNSLEKAAHTESGEHQTVDSSNFKILSLQKRSLKRVQPFEKAKITNNKDATCGDLSNSPSKLEPSKILDAGMSELHDLPTREKAGACVAASLTGGKGPSDLTHVGDNLQSRDNNIHLTDQPNCTGTLVIDGRMTNNISVKEQPLGNNGDANISEANNEIKDMELPQKVNHDEAHPSMENVDTCKKDDAKAASRMKKVGPKRSSYRCTLSNKSGKNDRNGTSLDNIESSCSYKRICISNQSSDKTGQAVRLREDLRIGKEMAEEQSEKTGNAEDGLEAGKKIFYEQNGTNPVPEDDKIIEEAIEVENKDAVEVENNSVSARSIHNVARDRMESSNREAEGAHLPISGTKSMDLDTNSSDISMDSDKENKPIENINCKHKLLGKNKKKSSQRTRIDNTNALRSTKCAKIEKPTPACFILSGHRLQRKEFQKVIRHLKGRLCRDSHQWSYQATHFIVPDPVRRTEKFFAAAASGRWILKTDYLTASNEAGKFLDEESFEWHRKGLTEDGAISLEAPRKWRLLREQTGHGAFYGMRIIVYGDCIAPTLDTLKRVVKAGDGIILATSPPYTRFLNSGVDYAVVSPSMPNTDIWVQEILRHEVPCVVADYLVEYVCKPGYSLERHVLYKTHAWAEKSVANLLRLSEEIVTETSPSPDENSGDIDIDIDDLCCTVCGLQDRAEVMLICGDENGTVGCGIGTHIDCCDPPLNAIPEEDWFCPKCSNRGTSNVTVKNKRVKKSSSSKAK